MYEVSRGDVPTLEPKPAYANHDCPLARSSARRKTRQKSGLHVCSDSIFTPATGQGPPNATQPDNTRCHDLQDHDISKPETEPITDARIIRVPGAPKCRVSSHQPQKHTREERTAFSKRLHRFVEKQKVNVFEPREQVQCDAELYRELQYHINEENPGAIVEKILEFCQPEHAQTSIEAAIEAICDCTSQLPLALGHRFAEALQSLMLNDAIKQEQSQITHMQHVAHLSSIHSQTAGQIKVLQSRIYELQGAKDDDMACVKTKLTELREQLAPHLEEMQKLRTQEIMEQAAISRNLAEFNELQHFCTGSAVDEQAHQRVQESMISIGTTKWRSSRQSQFPLEQTILQLESEIETLQKQIQEAGQRKICREELTDQLKSEVAAAASEQQQIATQLDIQQRQWHTIQTVAFRMQLVVGATKQIKMQLSNIEQYIYGMK